MGDVHENENCVGTFTSRRQKFSSSKKILKRLSSRLNGPLTGKFEAVFLRQFYASCSCCRYFPQKKLWRNPVILGIRNPRQCSLTWTCRDEITASRLQIGICNEPSSDITSENTGVKVTGHPTHGSLRLLSCALENIQMQNCVSDPWNVRERPTLKTNILENTHKSPVWSF